MSLLRMTNRKESVKKDIKSLAVLYGKNLIGN